MNPFDRNKPTVEPIDTRSEFLLGVIDPDGFGSYLSFKAHRDLDAIRNFRVAFGYAWKLDTIWEVPSGA